MFGLLGLMLLQESRRAARTLVRGSRSVLLEQQDRSLWRRDLIAEGTTLVERAMRSQGFGSYSIQAAIASVHAEGGNTGDDRLGTDRRAV